MRILICLPYALMVNSFSRDIILLWLLMLSRFYVDIAEKCDPYDLKYGRGQLKSFDVAAQTVTDCFLSVFFFKHLTYSIEISLLVERHME